MDENYTKKINKMLNVPLGISKVKQVVAPKERQNQLKYKLSFKNDYETLITKRDKVRINVKKYPL